MSEADIYTGSWVNWAKGPTLGATITLKSTEASFLTAFVAIFVTWAGGHLWEIISFSVNEFNASDEPQDGIYHHFQAALRNSQTAGSLVWNIAKIGWAWRRSPRSPFLRLLPVLILGSVYIVSITTAGIFSSSIGEAGEEVLLLPRNCGTLPNFPATAQQQAFSDEQQEQWTAFYVYQHLNTREAMVHAGTCYEINNKRESGERRCKDYSQERIGAFGQDLNAPCPFDSSMCETDSAVRIDTGLISSDADLGINTRVEDRMYLRKVTTWAPVALANHRTDFILDPTSNVGPESYQYVNLGKYSTNDGNTTWRMSNITNRAGLMMPYVLTPFVSFAESTTNDWTPIQELSRDDADVTILLLMNYNLYLDEVFDPFFRAGQSINASVHPSAPQEVDLFGPNETITVLGMTEQYQFCVDESNCSRLDSMYNIINTVGVLDFPVTENQQNLASRVFSAMSTTTVSNLVHFLGASGMLASDYRWGEDFFLSAGLPKDQWIHEAGNLHNISLALLQRMVVEWVAPSKIEVIPRSNKFTTDFAMSAQESFGRFPATESLIAYWNGLCSKQKVRSYQYTSFSTLGLALTFGIGGCIVLVNSVLSETVNGRRRKNGKSSYKEREWCENEFLQTQRMAFEAQNIGPWDGTTKAVPTTSDITLLWRRSVSAAVDTCKPSEHPELKAACMYSEDCATRWKR